MSILKAVADVSSITAFDVHDILPFGSVMSTFQDGETVIVTELIRSNQIVIARDKQMRIVVSSRTMAKRGTVLGEFVEETPSEMFMRWCRQAPPKMNYFWQAARNSGIINALEAWPPLRAEVQIFGHIIPSYSPGFPYAEPATKEPTVLIDRITIDHEEQAYLSFLPYWVPLFREDKFDPEILGRLAVGKEQVSGKQLHAREGIVIRHPRPKYTNTGQLILAGLYNVKVS